MITDKWRFSEAMKDKSYKYILDYRTIHEGKGENFLRDLEVIAKNLNFNIKNCVAYSYTHTSEKTEVFFKRDHKKNPLKKGQKTNWGTIQEVFFLDCPENASQHNTYQYKIDDMYLHEKSVSLLSDMFISYRSYQNGNLHLKCSIDFMKAFNIEASRLLGWIKSPQEAAQEMDITEQEAKLFFKSSLQLETKNAQLLLGM